MTLTASRLRSQSSSRLRWVPAAAGWTVGVIATLSLIASVSPVIRWLIRVPREFINDYIFNFPDTSFAWSFVLALLAGALTARKRIAWWLLVFNLLLAAGLNVAGLIVDHPSAAKRFGEMLGLGLHLAAVVVLIFAYREFWAKVRQGALYKAAGVLLTGWAIGILVSWGLVETFPRSLAAEDRLFYVVNRVVGFAVVEAAQFTGRPPIFLNALFGLFSAMALIVAAIVLFQSQRADNALTGEDESAIRGLLELWGKDDSLGYFATRRDKSVVFAPSGRAAITYRVEVGVCLASGDPIGDPRAWPQAIDAWLALCQTYGWTPGNMGASSAGAKAFREAGLNALELGDEAILQTAEFRLSGREMRGVRQAVTRARRAGLTVRIRRHHDIEPAEMAQVTSRADSWRDTEAERGFSMALGRVGSCGDEDCVIATATEDGVLRAILHFVPWGPDGLSLDLMRRDRAAQPGLNDFLIAETIKKAHDLGVKRISLNFAVFRAALERGERIGAGPVLRAWRGILVFLSRWFQIESLYKFNAKFCPEWVPRFFVYTGTRDIPRIGMAALEAEAFLVWPTVEARRIARRTARKLGLGKVRRQLRGPRRRPGTAA